MSDIGSGDEGISSQSTYLFTVVYRPGRLASRARCMCSLGQTPRSYKSKYLIVPVSKWRIQFGCESGSAAGEGSGAARRAGAAGGSAGADWGPTGEVVDLSIFFVCDLPLAGGLQPAAGQSLGPAGRPAGSARSAERRPRRPLPPVLSLPGHPGAATGRWPAPRNPISSPQPRAAW